MSRYARRPLTLQELWMDGQSVRVADLMNVTGFSRDAIHASIEAGDLQAFRRHERAAYRILRGEAQRWLLKCGLQRAS